MKRKKLLQQKKAFKRQQAQAKKEQRNFESYKKFNFFVSKDSIINISDGRIDDQILEKISQIYQNFGQNFNADAILNEIYRGYRQNNYKVWSSDYIFEQFISRIQRNFEQFKNGEMALNTQLKYIERYVDDNRKYQRSQNRKKAYKRNTDLSRQFKKTKSNYKELKNRLNGNSISNKYIKVRDYGNNIFADNPKAFETFREMDKLLTELKGWF